MLSNKGRHNTTKLGVHAVQELKINQRRILIDSLEIGIPAPKQMIALGERQLPNGVKVGQLLNSKTLNYKKFTPHRDGLFCERIFGPVQSFVCACGKKKESVHGKNRQKNMLTSTSTGGIKETTGVQKQALFCPKCQVEYISKDVRRHRLGYIKLFAPVTHIWYLKGRPSYLSLFLGKRKKAMTSLAYCNAFLVEQVYSDFRLETENVLKNVDKLTTDLLEKDNVTREQKSYTINSYNKFDKADSLDTQAKSSQLNSSENSFFYLLVKLFPETNIPGSLNLHSIKKKSIDKQEQKIKQLGKKRKLCRNLTKDPESEHSSGKLHVVQPKTNKVSASHFFQNNDALTESCYMRAQTLPFLPSLISPFHLRDCLISFLQSLPCKEDVPIPFYCQTVRRYPLRDVHKFITEFRSRESTKKAEKLTSESIARLKGLAKDRKLPITSYSKKARTKDSLVNLKVMPFGLINTFTRCNVTTVALPEINNSIIPEQNRVVLRSLINKREIKLTHFFSLKAKKETVKLLSSLFNSPFKNEPKNALFYLPYSSQVVQRRAAQDKALFSTVFCSKQEALLGYRGNKKFTYLHLPILLYVSKARFYCNTEQKNVFNIKWRVLAGTYQSFALVRGAKTLLLLKGAKLPYVKAKQCLEKGSTSFLHNEVLPFSKQALKKTKLCKAVQKGSTSFLQVRASALQTLSHKVYKGDTKVLQSLQSIKLFEQSKRVSLPFNVQTTNSKKKWSTYFAQPRIDYQLNLQNVSKNLFNTNVLSFSIKKDTQTYQARLLYVVFGAGKHDIHITQLTQPNKQVFLNKTNTFLYSSISLPEDSIDVNNRTKKKLNFSSVRKAKHDTISFTFETIQQEKEVILSSRPLYSFIQGKKSGDILTASLSINLPFFISGSKQNRVFFIIKKEKKVELNRKPKRSFGTCLQKGSTFFLHNKVFAHQNIAPLRKSFAFAIDNRHSCASSKKTFVFLSNAPESVISETDQHLLPCLSSCNKSSDFISRCFPDVTVFSCALLINVMISEQRTVTRTGDTKTSFWYRGACKKEVLPFCKLTGYQNEVFAHKAKLCEHNSLKKSIKLHKTCVNAVLAKNKYLFFAQRSSTKYSVFASKVRRNESDKKIEQKISITSIRNLIKNSSDQVFTKMYLEQRHAILLATRSCSLFLGGSVLNHASLFSSSKTLKLKSDQVKVFTDTNQLLSKDSQTSFGSEMISKWHLHGAKEILLYTGGGALESLLKRFNISLFYEFLFGEIKILRKYYKNQMFFIADYNKKKTLEKQSPAETKQSFVTQKRSSACKNEVLRFYSRLPAVFDTPVPYTNKVCVFNPSLLQDSFGTNTRNQTKSKNTYFYVSPRSSHQKALVPSKQQICSRLGPENNFNNSQDGKESVPELRATTVMQEQGYKNSVLVTGTGVPVSKNFVVQKGSTSFLQAPRYQNEVLVSKNKVFAPPARVTVFNAYERRSHFVKAAIKAEIPSSFDRGKKQKKARLYKDGALFSSCTNKISTLPVVTLDHQKRELQVELQERALQKSSSPKQSKAFLTVEKSTNSFCRRIYRTTRRLKIVQLLMRSQRRPEWMMISILPVLPPDLRPLLQMGENLIVASDLNTLYQRVIYRNNRHYKGRFLDFHFVSSIQRLVQDAVDRLIENGKGGSTPFLTPGGRPLKSLSDILKGKRGRFRFNLLGKRVDFSGRSVIVVSPQLQIHECGLPREMALELYKYLLIRQLLLKKRVSSIVNAKKVIKERKSFVWDMLRDIIYYHPLLLNRAPTLHRLGIQAFQPKLTLGNAILLHPLVCAGFNADFDGDQMGVHLPLSPQARAEAWDLLWSRNNLLSPATGQPILLPSQDMVLGFYYMTALLPSGTTFTPRNEELQINTEKKPNSASYFLDKANSIASSKNKNLPYIFSDTYQIVHAYQKKQIDIHTPIWLKWSGQFENGEKSQIPVELRLDIFGSKTQIYPTYKYKSYITFSLRFKKNNVVTIHIRTTVGRVLVNNVIRRN